MVATGVGEPGSKIRFADLTGDGKADYILIGTVATRVSTQGPVYYADINGDEKADYLVAFDGSAVNAYINSYDWIPDEGEDDGKDEDDDDNDTNECTPAPKTYSEEQIDRVGEHMDWEKMEKTNSAIVGVQYVTIVNLQTRGLMGLCQSPRGPILWDYGLKEDFFDKLRRINNRCPNMNHENSFETYKMGTLMGQNKGKGCVLIFLNTGNLEEKIEEKDRISEKDGIYNKDSIKLTDAWPDKRNTKDMAEWVVTEWKKEKTDMYIDQWVVTANYAPGGETRSILQTSVLATNPALYWRGVNEISPTAFPNVLLVDYIGNVLLNVNEPDWNDLSAEMQVLTIGLNLYMISENCKINSQRPPLLPSDSKALGLTSGRSKAKS
ncbi:hypothetical protein CDV31_004725 [Fusarium ambrosium]|uniref:Uncharacterized protein n=1 Tax=Fusarium ambrosium TaxID=131363 RepID=A0A428UP67_9HYPO|nr:hypothetical protein CDV31_004725 [Fusarium ambrosium]